MRNLTSAARRLSAWFLRRSKDFLQRQAEDPPWERLPERWKVLPQHKGSEAFELLFLLPINTVQLMLAGVPSIASEEAVVKLGHVLPVFDVVRESVTKVSEVLVRLGDRFSSAATLRLHAPQLAAELPGSLARRVVFEPKLGLHHTEVLLRLLQALEHETGAPARRMAELGTFEGQTPQFLLQRLPALHVTTVDPYSSVEGAAPEYVEKAARHRQVAIDTLQPFGERAAMVLATSEQACALFADGLFDLVFVDGGPRAEEVRCWKSKVRPGGFLVGHDFKCSMGWPYLREIFEALPESEALHLAPDWVWYLRWRVPDS